jgi:hypothetical protein
MLSEVSFAEADRQLHATCQVALSPTTWRRRLSKTQHSPDFIPALRLTLDAPAVAPRMTAQILASELGTLIQDSKRKNSELRSAAEKALQDLKSLPVTSEIQLAAGMHSRSMRG